MTTTPLPPPELLQKTIDRDCPNCRARLMEVPPLALGYTADQMQAYAQQARADLEAEVQRFREHLTKQNAELDELIPMAQKLEAENKRLREALKDIARQPEGDEDSAQAVARAALKDTK